MWLSEFWDFGLASPVRAEPPWASLLGFGVHGAEPRGRDARMGGAARKDHQMDDKEILRNIDDLIKTEHGLRSRLAAGDLTTEDEQEQLRAVEAQLDQCWDLLRQRRARREFGEDPSGTTTRPVDEVESYLQ